MAIHFYGCVFTCKQIMGMLTINMAIGSPPDDNGDELPGCSREPMDNYRNRCELTRLMRDQANRLNEYIQGQMTALNIQGNFSAVVVQRNENRYDVYGTPVMDVTINGATWWDYLRIVVLYYFASVSRIHEEQVI